MAEKINISTPAGSAGIFRFYEAGGGGIKIDPSFVILAAIAFVVGIVVLKFVVKA
jgi:preprotein translocase subunit Sec61beta